MRIQGSVGVYLEGYLRCTCPLPSSQKVKSCTNYRDGKGKEANGGIQILVVLVSGPEFYILFDKKHLISYKHPLRLLMPHRASTIVNVSDSRNFSQGRIASLSPSLQQVGSHPISCIAKKRYIYYVVSV